MTSLAVEKTSLDRSENQRTSRIVGITDALAATNRRIQEHGGGYRREGIFTSHLLDIISAMGSPRPTAPVLVIEDNTDTRSVLRTFLEIDGYVVAQARDGAEALDYLRSGGGACLIILDLRMPVMDGSTFLSTFHANPAWADIPVIAFSAVLEGDVPGTVASIRKAAVNPDVLLALIERAAINS